MNQQRLGKILETVLFLGVLPAVLIPSGASAQTYKVLYSFQCGADGARPQGGVIRDSGGNLYGTTFGGGNAGLGTVFEVSSDGTETVLHSFTNTLDGAEPVAGLLRDKLGNLYGTTEEGGGPTGGLGTVFRLSTDGTLTPLHAFTGPPDGQFPIGGVISDGAGNLYGTTSQGGSDGDGTIFTLSLTGNRYSILHNFNGSDGLNPQAGVIRDTSGKLYGTTAAGGTFNAGTAFTLDTSDMLNVLHSFAGSPDGQSVYGGLLRDAAGNLYGTTQAGGTSINCAIGCGTVFKIDTTNVENILFSFTGQRGGGQPFFASLVEDKKGSLYGTTLSGGSLQCVQGQGAGCGVVFRINQTGQEKVLHSFTGAPTDGALPRGGLLQTGRTLYGTTEFGGSGDCGTVFQYTP